MEKKQVKYVYNFKEGKKEMKNLLGGKGANLAEMTSLGLPIPSGFTITTEACDLFYKQGKKLTEEVMSQVKQKLEELEKETGKKLGDKKNPLLVSVRSGAAASMPGMMDTILNLGLNDETVESIVKNTENPRFAYDSYRRFMQMFGDVVMEVEHHYFEEVLQLVKTKKGVKFDTELNAEDMKEVIKGYKELIKEKAGRLFPSDTKEQLEMAIYAVFNSWNNSRAISYRRMNHISGLLGTAVNVQSMVFGNMGDDSGTGVCFTRNPSTGQNEFYGEYLMNAQGEDVVAGIRTPETMDKLKEDNPKIYNQLNDIREKLEKHYKDMQDMEFTIEKGKLFMLQTRNGKRTAAAAVKIAVDLVKEGLITKEQALLKVEAESLNQLLHKQLDSKLKRNREMIAKGLPASPGAAVGKVVFTAERAYDLAQEGEKVILVRTETSPEDIEGMHAAQGILTARGGMTCVAGDSLILTDSGFFSAEQLFDTIESGAKPKILSFDSASMKTKWKNVIATGRKKSEVIEIDVSQSGRTNGNTITLTPDHKMMMINNRQIEKTPIEDVLEQEQMISIIDKIPGLDKFVDSDYAYLAGALFTDGYIHLNNRRGGVTFTQKSVPEKFNFINKVKNIFFDKFGKQMNERKRKSDSVLEGREIHGSCSDYSCYQKAPAKVLLETKQNLVQWALNLDEQATFSFLAGLLDGDGSYSQGRFHLYIGKLGLMPAVIVSCLKLGIVPQVTPNREHFNVQIVEKIEEISRFTARLKPSIYEKKYESKLFSLRQMFGDVQDKVDFRGTIKPGIKENKMLGFEKIKEYVLNFKKLDLKLKQEIENIINSNLRMYRVKKTQEKGIINVYNFEVDSSKEADKNFVVFTKRFTPLLVSNSHAAVVARGMGKCCVAGCSDIRVSERDKVLEVKGKSIKEGDVISLDGATGEVFLGAVDLIEPELSGDFGELMKWADEFRKLKIRTNADTPKDAAQARKFGAEGIGLCRTEHMFFEESRIKAVREMILAETKEGRKKELAKILPMQRQDFKELFEIMDGLPVTIRYLDPPLHEFLPKEEKDIQEIAKELNVSADVLKKKIEDLHEFNPMLGHRGCRLGITYPEISEMQSRAVFEAAAEIIKSGKNIIPEVMIPLVGHIKEFENQKQIVEAVAKEVMKEQNIKIQYSIGTMIEVPRGALTADEIAKSAEFFSFGTNDLTQMTCGFSRDDSGKFLNQYVSLGIYERDPFQTLDREGVGKLMKIALTKGRAVRKNMKMGICGEHGGDPATIEFCHRIGLSYVSCSPFRVPIARLAAAQASIKAGQNNNSAKGKEAIISKTINKNQKPEIKNKPQVKILNAKPLPKAKSIREEIREIIREEMKNLKSDFPQKRKTGFNNFRKKRFFSNQK